MEVRLSGNNVYTTYHMYRCRKYRCNILNLGLSGHLRKLFPKVLRSLSECEIIEYNIQVNRIHIVMIISPSYKVSGVVGRIKFQTASKLRKKFS